MLVRLTVSDCEREGTVRLAETVEAVKVAVGVGDCEGEGEGVEVAVGDGALGRTVHETLGLTDGLRDSVVERVVEGRGGRVAVALVVKLRALVRVEERLLNGQRTLADGAWGVWHGQMGQCAEEGRGGASPLTHRTWHLATG